MPHAEPPKLPKPPPGSPKTPNEFAAAEAIRAAKAMFDIPEPSANASFAKLKTAATGKADAKEAAKKIACAYIPG